MPPRRRSWPFSLLVPLASLGTSSVPRTLALRQAQDELLGMATVMKHNRLVTPASGGLLDVLS